MEILRPIVPSDTLENPYPIKAFLMTRTCNCSWLKLFFLVSVSAFILSSNLATAMPQRIVSMSLASDEILLELLSNCKGNFSRLVAVSTFATDPDFSNVRDLAAKIPTKVHSEVEGILKLKPDLLIAASFNRPEVIDLLKRRGIPLLILTKFSSVTDIITNIDSISQSVGCQKEGQVLVEEFKKKIAEIRAKASKLPRQSAVSFSPDQTVMAANTLFDDLLAINNLVNLPAAAGLKDWPRIDPEMLKKWNPDWIILSCEGATECAQARKLAKNNAAWKNLQAVIKGHFIEVSPRILQSTSQYFGLFLDRAKSR